MKGNWSVYLLLCADQTLYAGVTNDMEKRLAAHNGGKAGAKYTKARQPVKLVYQEPCATRSDAQKREAELRKLPRAKKLLLVKSVDK